jgi:hypothetical protein
VSAKLFPSRFSGSGIASGAEPFTDSIAASALELIVPSARTPSLWHSASEVIGQVRLQISGRSTIRSAHDRVAVANAISVE